MRQFIRHPVDVLVEIDIEGQAAPPALHTHDISQGGLALMSSCSVPTGADVEIRIPCVVPPFHAHARVAWCHPHTPPGWELGLTFLDADDAFRTRMVEQACHIEDYRLSVQRLEGRDLSPDEAAYEWIGKYAAQFPEIGPVQVH
jgi:hypothetical protein